MSGVNMPNTQKGGTSGFKVGSLKRKLDTITLARLSGSEATTLGTTETFRLLLKNLFGDLNVQIACGINNVTGSSGPVRPSQYPAAGTAFGTIQCTPINNFPDATGKVYLRPVFQDPTAAVNENHSLPMDIPFGWEFNTRCDEVEIEVVLTAAGWVNSNLFGNIVVEVTVEYDGEWWDEQAIQFALSQVTLVGGPTEVKTISTQIG